MAATTDGVKDARELDRIRGILSARINSKKPSSPSVALIVTEDGTPYLEYPEGVSRAEAEIAMVRGLLACLLQDPE